jgi:hypothetical protein
MLAAPACQGFSRDCCCLMNSDPPLECSNGRWLVLASTKIVAERYRADIPSQ